MYPIVTSKIYFPSHYNLFPSVLIVMVDPHSCRVIDQPFWQKFWQRRSLPALPRKILINCGTRCFSEFGYFCFFCALGRFFSAHVYSRWCCALLLLTIDRLKFAQNGKVCSTLNLLPVKSVLPVTNLTLKVKPVLRFLLGVCKIWKRRKTDEDQSQFATRPTTPDSPTASLSFELCSDKTA